MNKTPSTGKSGPVGSSPSSGTYFWAAFTLTGQWR